MGKETLLKDLETGCDSKNIKKFRESEQDSGVVNYVDGNLSSSDFELDEENIDKYDDMNQNNDIDMTNVEKTVVTNSTVQIRQAQAVEAGPKSKKADIGPDISSSNTKESPKNTSDDVTMKDSNSDDVQTLENNVVSTKCPSGNKHINPAYKGWFSSFFACCTTTHIDATTEMSTDDSIVPLVHNAS